MIQNANQYRYNQRPIRTCGKCSRLFLHVGAGKRDNCDQCHKATAEIVPTAMKNRIGHKHMRPSHRLEITCKECRTTAVIWGTSRVVGMYCSRKCAALARGRKRVEKSRTIDALVGGVQEKSGKAVSAGVLKWLQGWRRVEVRARAMSFACVACGAQAKRSSLINTTSDICRVCARDVEIRSGRTTRRLLAPKSRKSKVFRYSIYNRDGWACYLCGVTVEACKEYKPTQATLDHVTPLSKGGKDTEDNCKTCCQQCNSRKGNA